MISSYRRMSHRTQTHDCMTEDRTEMWTLRWGHSGGEIRRATSSAQSAGSTCVVCLCRAYSVNTRSEEN
eukprot:475018-Prymnesium_polylepis.1